MDRNTQRREGPPGGDGMLFVRIRAIPCVMVRAPLLAAGLIAVAVMAQVQGAQGMARGLDLIIYPDGSTHVTAEFEVDPQQPDHTVGLFGSTVDNFVAVGDGGFLLESRILGQTATIETFGASSAYIEYDIHDLVSKQGRVWSFALDAPSDYSLLMPENAVIVGMSNLPLSMDIVDDRTRLLLPEGPAQIEYIFGASPIVPVPPPPVPDVNPPADTGVPPAVVGGIIAVAAGAAGAVGAMYLRGRRTPAAEIAPAVEAAPEPPRTPDPEAVFGRIPELREDDKEIVTFLSANGGQARESELRKKFLLPRTTMWRAVKRLERYGIIEIQKMDQQNLVKLREDAGEQ